MRKNTLIIAGIIATNLLFAQRTSKLEEKTSFVTCSEFHVTKPLSEIFANNPLEGNNTYRKQESEDRENNRPQKFPLTVEKDGPAYGNDPSTIQTTDGFIHNRAPLQSWAGQTASGFTPLDPCGAAGPNNYVQMINATTFKVYSKTGTAQLTGTLGNLWTPHQTYNDGDPIVLYDKAADRWFFSQFGDNDGAAGNYVHIAISQTGDPTGAWYTYTFTAPFFPDYLKFSVWQDGYYMTCNSNSAGASPTIFVFERTKMLAGNSAARMLTKTYAPSYNSGWFFIPLTADGGDGALPATGAPCPIFSYSDNGWGSGYTDAINVFHIAVNWTPTTPTATVTAAGTIAAAAFDASYDSNWNDVSQPGTTEKLDGIGGALMFRAQYKIFSGYNSVVLCWGVKISSTQRGIKWCELRQTGGTTSSWTMYQEGIFAPATDNRWMGSISQDNNGSIALCYLRDNATSMYPSLYYTGRRSCDPLGTFTVAETLVKAGTASQSTSTGNRDGDYAETWLDPDGVTFWNTGMYIGSGGSQQTQIYSFQIAACAASVPPVASFTAASTSVCAGQSIAFTDNSTNSPTSWAWTFAGPTTLTSASQSPTMTFATAGTYSVTLVATNSAGSNTSAVTSITVKAIPGTPAPTTNSPICAGATINLNSTAVTGATYAWAGPSTYTATTQNATRPTATAAMAGTYSLTVTVNGCTSVAGTSTVVVNAKPTISNTTLTQTICSGATASFMATSATTGSTFAWTASASAGTVTGWTASGSGNISNVLTNTGTTNGTVTYVVTPTGPTPTSCAGTASNFVVTVKPTPSTPVITQNGNVLTSSSATGNQWYHNGTAISGATGQTYTETANGTYTDIVTTNGCSSTVSNTITVINTGINELTLNNSLSIYPNPNNGIFTVSFDAASKTNYKIEITNEIGQLVFKQAIKDASGTYSQTIDISTYGKGMYLFTLTDDKNQSIKKVLVY